MVVPLTTNTSKHTPSGFCYVIVDSHGKAIKQSVLCTGRNVIYKFLTSLLDEVKEIEPILKNEIPIHMTPADETIFQNSIGCHLCRKPLVEDRVRNHDHIR